MPNFSEQVTEAHEERLQRLEVDMKEVVTATATTGVKMDHLVEKIDAGFATINQRMDEGKVRFEKHDEALTKLQTTEDARASRWATVKKATLPLLAVAAGVIATKGGEHLWTWLISIFQ